MEDSPERPQQQQIKQNKVDTIMKELQTAQYRILLNKKLYHKEVTPEMQNLWKLNKNPQDAQKLNEESTKFLEKYIDIYERMLYYKMSATKKQEIDNQFKNFQYDTLTRKRKARVQEYSDQRAYKDELDIKVREIKEAVKYIRRIHNLQAAANPIKKDLSAQIGLINGYLKEKPASQQQQQQQNNSPAYSQQQMQFQQSQVRQQQQMQQPQMSNINQTQSQQVQKQQQPIQQTQQMSQQQIQQRQMQQQQQMRMQKQNMGNLNMDNKNNMNQQNYKPQPQQQQGYNSQQQGYNSQQQFNNHTNNQNQQLQNRNQPNYNHKY